MFFESIKLIDSCTRFVNRFFDSSTKIQEGSLGRFNMERLMSFILVIYGLGMLVLAEYRVLGGLLKVPGGWDILGIYATLGISLIVVGVIGFYLGRER